MSDASAEARVAPAIRSQFLSHGTMESRDLDTSRRFYEEFFGFDTVRPSKMSLWIRLGGEHIYVVVKNDKKEPMPFLYHNGVDVVNEAEVDRSYEAAMRDAEKWNLKAITKPSIQHGTYSFYFMDGDDNYWEILANPKGGYTWMWSLGDQDGMGHLKKSFARPKYDASNGDD